MINIGKDGAGSYQGKRWFGGPADNAAGKGNGYMGWASHFALRKVRTYANIKK